MKLKSATVLIILIFIPLMKVCAAEGSARIAAMGNPMAAVYDISTSNDLYANGFEAAVFTRHIKTKITIQPELFIYNKEINDAAFPDESMLADVIKAGNSMYQTENTGIVISTKESTVTTIRPYFNFRNGKITHKAASTTYEGPADTGFLAGIYAELGQKVNDRLTAGLAGGWYADSCDIEYSASGVSEGRTERFEKVSFNVSLALLPESDTGWTFAASAGNRLMDIPRTNISMDLYGPDPERAVFTRYGLFDAHYYYKAEDAVYKYESFTDLAVTGTKVNLGAAFADADRNELTVRTGLLLNYEMTEKYRQQQTHKPSGQMLTANVPFDSAKEKGFGFNGALAARKNMGDIILGAKASADMLCASWSGQTTVIDSVYGFYKSQIGITFLSGAFLFPVELGYDAYSESNKLNNTEVFDLLNDISVKAGMEYTASKELSVRTGVDCNVISSDWWHKENGDVIDASAAAGTADNRYYVQLGASFGLGFSYRSGETSVTLRYMRATENPQDQSYRFTENCLKLMTDIKFFL